MQTFELILSKPNPRSKELSLFFDLHDTPIARKFFNAVDACVRRNCAIYEPDRVYNFPGDPRNRDWIADRLNHCIDVINDYSPGLIRHRAKPVMDQELMNHLHHYFEKYRGPVLNPPAFFLIAPPEIKKALEDFNILIHRYEDYDRNEQYVKSGYGPAAKVVVTFENRERFLLADEDYHYFSKQVVFGRWYVNYCEVGKPIWDLYQDRDEVVGGENIVPLRYYSADSLIEFSPSITEETARNHLESLNAWWDDHTHLMDQLGFKKGDPKNAIGDIPVADLSRDRGVVAGMENSRILELIGPYQSIRRVVCHKS
jgi:hypothetical protein